MRNILFKFYQNLLEGWTNQDFLEDYLEHATAYTLKRDDGKTETIIEYYCKDGSIGGYNEFFQEWSQKKANELCFNIELKLSKSTNEEIPDLIPQIIFDTNFYLRKMKEKDWGIYSFLLKDYLKVIPDIYAICKHYIHLRDVKLDLDKLIQASNEDIVPSPAFEPGKGPKIQWLGKTNVLLTLFYDLLMGQDGQSPLIKIDKKDLKEFIKSHFVDAEGNEFSKATIETVFSSTREEKRANREDRIELTNVKIKKVQ